MKITAIKQQLKKTDRFSVFVDGKYTFSLGSGALLKSKLVVGQEVSASEVKRHKEVAADDKLFDLALRYVTMRLRSEWEMAGYLKRKGASPTLAKTILNKLSNTGLLDDAAFAKAFISDRQRFRPTSRRKMLQELRAKHVAEDAIKQVIQSDDEIADERTALLAIIQSKRRQTRYQDDLKLAQYLVRQGFNYGDVKAALQNNDLSLE